MPYQLSSHDVVKVRSDCFLIKFGLISLKMSVSLEQIMSDARLLQARLTERGKLGEALHYEVIITYFQNLATTESLLWALAPFIHRLTP